MKEIKKRKINTLVNLLTSNSGGDIIAKPEDENALHDLREDVNVDELKAYMKEQRIAGIKLESKRMQKEKRVNPFEALETKRLAELTEYPNDYVSLGAKLELARRNFFFFCHLRAPDFYNPEREYIVELCNEMQSFCDNDDEKVLIINMPPRYGKSRTAGFCEQWLYGKTKSHKIITGSYNETLSTTFSKSVRDAISEVKADLDKIVYSDIFPDVRIKRGDAAMNLWSLEGEHFSYLATSPGGTATGFGASVIIMDDLIKSAEEALNDNYLENIWNWFRDTIFSRRETSRNWKIIIIMTRWASGDLAGRMKEHCETEKIPYKLISMKAHLGDGKMLCPEIQTYEDYIMTVNIMSEEIASANYQQQPIDLKGKLYKTFKTYEDIPRDEKGNPLFTSIKAYCDTADTGSDYLCNIIYGVYQKEAYVLDVYYTLDGMEETEPETAKRLYQHKVRIADIESNNGGRGFARNVKRLLLEKHRSNLCRINWFHQSKNKRARILTNSTWVQDHIYFPVDWRTRWPDYYKAMYKYQKSGKNAHDDAPDATTGVAEKLGGSGGVSVLK